MKRFLSIGLLALAGACMAPPLLAQSNCGPRDVVVDTLENTYGERVQVNGIAANNAFMELYANLHTRTWSVIVGLASGDACIVMSGEDYGEVFEPMGEDL